MFIEFYETTARTHVLRLLLIRVFLTMPNHGKSIFPHSILYEYSVIPSLNSNINSSDWHWHGQTYTPLSIPSIPTDSMYRTIMTNSRRK